MSFFKRKSQSSADLAFTRVRSAESLDDAALVRGLLRVVEGGPPIVPAMCLIAYENVFLLKAGFERIMKGVPECTPSQSTDANSRESPSTTSLGAVFTPRR